MAVGGWTHLFVPPSHQIVATPLLGDNDTMLFGGDLEAVRHGYWYVS